MFRMPGLWASGVCLLLACIASLLLTKDGIWQRHLLVSGNAAPPGESDCVSMLQAKGEVEVARAKGENSQHMNIYLSSVQQKSVDPSKLGATMRNTHFPAKSFSFDPSAEAHVVTEVGSHDSEEPRSHSRSSFASLERWRSTAIRFWRHRTMESNATILPSTVALIYVGFLTTSCVLLMVAHLWLGKGKGKGINALPFEERSLENTAKAPKDEKTSVPVKTETGRMSEARLTVSIEALLQAAANERGGSSEISFSSNASQERIPIHVIISKVYGGERIEVDTVKGQTGSQVTIEPLPNTSGAKSKSLEIRGSNVSLPRGRTATFYGTLEEDSAGRHVVLQDCCPIVLIRGGLDPKSLALTTPGGKLLASVFESGGHQLEMRIGEGADTSLVLAAALAVALRSLS